jgi:hypothetical protein
MTDEGLDFGIEMADEYQHVYESIITSKGLTVGETYFMGHKTEKGTWSLSLKCSRFDRKRRLLQ